MRAYVIDSSGGIVEGPRVIPINDSPMMRDGAASLRLATSKRSYITIPLPEGAVIRGGRLWSIPDVPIMQGNRESALILIRAQGRTSKWSIRGVSPFTAFYRALSAWAKVVFAPASGRNGDIEGGYDLLLVVFTRMVFEIRGEDCTHQYVVREGGELEEFHQRDNPRDFWGPIYR